MPEFRAKDVHLYSSFGDLIADGTMVAIAIEVATRGVCRTARFAKAMRAAICDGRSLVDTIRNKKKAGDEFKEMKKKAKKAKTAKKGKPKKTRKAKKENSNLIQAK